MTHDPLYIRVLPVSCPNWTQDQWRALGFGECPDWLGRALLFGAEEKEMWWTGNAVCAPICPLLLTQTFWPSSLSSPINPPTLSSLHLPPSLHLSPSAPFLLVTQAHPRLGVCQTSGLRLEGSFFFLRALSPSFVSPGREVTRVHTHAHSPCTFHLRKYWIRNLKIPQHAPPHSTMPCHALFELVRTCACVRGVCAGDQCARREPLWGALEHVSPVCNGVCSPLRHEFALNSTTCPLQWTVQRLGKVWQQVR
jgi:hypothetical protein